MAACGSLQRFFENPLPENPTLLESVASWNPIKPMNPIELSTFTEIFGELHFKEAPESSPPSFPLPVNQNPQPKIKEIDACTENRSFNSLLGTCKNHDTGCFTSLNSESLQLCTEGLGFESSDEVENSKNERTGDWRNHEKGDTIKHSLVNLGRNLRNCSKDVIGAGSVSRKSRVDGSFPPPISCLGKRGKPCFSFRSYRHDGRFVLTEIKIPNHEILHASREDGRLKLHLVPPTEESTKEEEEQEEEEELRDSNEEEDGEEEEEEEEEEVKKSARTPEICNG